MGGRAGGGAGGGARARKCFIRKSQKSNDSL